MMFTRNLIVATTLMLLCQPAFAQSKWNLELGLNLGASRLFHQTRFESTVLNNVYEFVAISHPGGYSWEQFAEDYDLRKSYMQPRFGFSAHLTHKEIPVFCTVDATSSSSSYQFLAYSVAVGIGKDWSPMMDTSLYFSLQGGYKYVFRDNGFGAETITNSLGNKEGRDLLATFFAPKEPLGQKKGSLFMVRGGIGKIFGERRRLRWGVEAYGELDLTNETTRESRMTVVGLNTYLRINFLQ